MSISIKGEIVIELGKNECFISEGNYGEKRALGFGNKNHEHPSIVITFETPESVNKFVKDITGMLKDTGA